MRGAPPPAAIASPLIARDFDEHRKATTAATSLASTIVLVELPAAMCVYLTNCYSRGNWRVEKVYSAMTAQYSCQSAKLMRFALIL